MSELHKHYVLYRPGARPYQGLQNITKLQKSNFTFFIDTVIDSIGSGNVAELENLTLSYL